MRMVILLDAWNPVRWGGELGLLDLGDSPWTTTTTSAQRVPAVGSSVAVRSHSEDKTMAELTDGTYKIIHNDRDSLVMTLDPHDRVSVILPAPEQGNYGPLQEWTVQTVGDGEFILSNKLTGAEVAFEGWGSPIKCQGHPGLKWALYNHHDSDDAVVIGIRGDHSMTDPNPEAMLLPQMWVEQGNRVLLVEGDTTADGSFWHFQAV